MLATLFGNVSSVKPLQYSKAESPMRVTLFGNTSSVNSLHQPKAESPMLVTPLGMTLFLHPTINVLVSVSIIELQLSRES